MKIQVGKTKQEMGKMAAEIGAAAIREAISKRGKATIIVATGASQFEMLGELVKVPDIRWDKVTGFHLDEYVGLPITHPASFRKYLWERFVSKLPLPMTFNFVDAETDAAGECRRLGEMISRHTVDVCFCGIGENGHLAFNDPPADFQTENPYLVVDLDDACRKQQLGEGWFPSFNAVPSKAISMSIRQIMKSRKIICTVPDERKAQAVKNTIEGPVTNRVPASIMQQHPDCTLFVDPPAIALLSRQPA